MQINNDLQDDYCSFEVSKLLKEKGFDVPTTGYYRIHGDKAFFGYAAFKHNNDKENETAGGMTYVAIPTHALAIKWIRENFNWNVEVGYRNSHKDYLAQIYPIFPNTEVRNTGRFTSSEEATEAALKYTLEKLIPTT